jgi:1-acyl-sn-glycerol-3-phosphate acyltransferase
MYFFALVSGFIISLILYLVIAVTSVLSFFVSLMLYMATFLFDKKRKTLHLFTSACLIFWGTLMPLWRIRISGKEKMPVNTPCVIVSNHQSWLDILVSAYVFADFKWISKAEILKVPFIGWQMALNKYITLKRGYFNSTEKMMKDCDTTLKSGSSLWIFPEGTRASGSHTNSFKTGAFVLAQQNRVPVLPVVIHGTGGALPVNRFFTTGFHKISVKILDPFYFGNDSSEGPEIIAEKTRGLIEKHLAILSRKEDLGL